VGLAALIWVIVLSSRRRDCSNRHISERRFVKGMRCAELAEYAFEPDAFDLVHAALVLEYVDWLPLLPRFASTLRPRGTLSVVLQRPSVSSPAVTPTAFASLRSPESVFHFVEPDVLVALASDVGLGLDYRRTEPLPSAKSFEVLRFLTGPGRRRKR
jgi:methyltransferase family protein